MTIPDDPHRAMIDQIVFEASVHRDFRRPLERVHRTGLWGSTLLETLVRLAEAQLRQIDAAERKQAP